MAENIFARLVSGIVTADEVLAQRFIGKAAHIVSAHNYPNLIDFAPLRKDLADERSLILSMGGFFEERCASTIAMAEAIARVDLKIGGGKDDKTLARFPDFSGYIGRLSFQEVREHYARMKIGIVMFSDAPNHQDIRSNRLFETLNAGVPVIVSDMGHWRSFV